MTTSTTMPEPTQPELGEEAGARAVFRNGGFLRLWLSQAATQIGGNMVLYGLTVIVFKATNSTTAVSLLILSFLIPAVLLSAVAGVYVDRIDRRKILIATNILRAVAFVALYFAGTNLILILLLNITVSTLSVFFAPAELAMIPILVPRPQLLTANGIFTLTLNAAFVLGFALLGPLVVKVAGAETVILVVAALYFLAAIFCVTLPAAPPPASTTEEPHTGLGVGEAERAVGTTLAQLREGFAFIRMNRAITWSLIYLAITASLIGVLGVLGPDFAKKNLRLSEEDFVVVVLPLGFGVVTGILLLNSFGHLFPRRRIIEGGLIALGIFVLLIVVAGPISGFLQKAERATGLATALADFTSLLSVVVFIALLAGIAYACVAIPAQTQLQEDIPEDARGRVFGVLNMLVSVASFLPIIILGSLSDVVGTPVILIVVAISITAAGIISIVRRGPLSAAEARATAHGPASPAGLDPVAVATASELLDADGRRAADARVRAKTAEAAVATGPEVVEAADTQAAEAVGLLGHEAAAGGPAENE